MDVSCGVNNSLDDEAVVIDIDRLIASPSLHHAVVIQDDHAPVKESSQKVLSSFEVQSSNQESQEGIGNLIKMSLMASLAFSIWMGFTAFFTNSLSSAFRNIPQCSAVYLALLSSFWDVRATHDWIL
ncbi:hypothetical protein ACH5RR_002667 [Cinchona calisaya]|uniref:Uncharacterized protein n=1 Tax=Cinchona calisaya TaxID=153742 RepID=A0ABD3ASQ4_9GENT